MGEQQVGAWIVKVAGYRAVYADAGPDPGDGGGPRLTTMFEKVKVFDTQAAALNWLEVHPTVSGWILVPLADELLNREARRTP